MAGTGNTHGINYWEYLARRDKAHQSNFGVIQFDREQMTATLVGDTSTYTISIFPYTTCTCTDFRLHSRRGPCKHIIFMLLCYFNMDDQACFDSWALYYENNHRSFLSPQSMHFIASRYTDAIQKAIRAKPETKKPTAQNDADCVICYEPIAEIAPTFTCAACGHRIHSSCWATWKQRSATCPFCRCRQDDTWLSVPRIQMLV